MQGYQKFAAFLSSNRDFALLRKYDALQIKDLLFQQAELTHLEAQLENIIQEDEEAFEKGEKGRSDLSLSWDKLKRSKDRMPDRLQYDKTMEVRKALKEYC
jgi:hypothetical protein